ncbi:unnamed protein product [Candida verbasci]|uniref:asparaginase n=1 Tax=Candida verbasci TaxID=1227364 RepID=A0A9W4TTC2_9ASCO|nr:unnamed protein product [Candida verbasci]
MVHETVTSVTNFVPIDERDKIEHQVEIESYLDSQAHFKLNYRSNSIVSIDEVEKLPKVKVLGTGGTIASKGSNSSQTAGYSVDLTIENLISSIPDLSPICQLEYEQIFNLDSKEIGAKEALKLYNQIILDLPHYDGIVITHGTDTMEETAFFLQLTINTSKPIVLCGSMRPSTAISSDGPMNLYEAIVIASSKNSYDRGILVALNDKIGSGWYITKSNTNSLETFKNIGQGYIGDFVNNEIYYFYPPRKPSGIEYFNIENVKDKLPDVAIVFGHPGLNNEIFKLLIENLKMKGIILATMGAGSMKDETNQYLADLLKDKPEYPIIYSKRSMDGKVPIGALPNVIVDGQVQVFNNAVAGGYLNPQKSRILLSLCLNEGYNLEKIKKIFRKV